MKTADLLALCAHPRARHLGSFERRSVVIGAILTTLFLGAMLLDAYAPNG